MKKILVVMALICIALLSCTREYEERIERHLTYIDNNLNSDIDVKSLTTSMQSNGVSIQKAIIDSNFKLFGGSKIDEYRERYEKALDKYYERAYLEISKELDDIKYKHCPALSDLPYTDFLNRTPEYRVDEICVGRLCGVTGDDRSTYYNLANKILEVYSVIITNKMRVYRSENVREYFPSMDGINKCKEEVIEHLIDDRYVYNKMYKEHAGDYLKQKEYAEKMDALTDKIKELEHTTYTWALATEFL